tara:strand:- start:891 stop:1085 length:195 start_codon:yes stop_codon:yes gene_type:complete
LVLTVSIAESSSLSSISTFGALALTTFFGALFLAFAGAAFLTFGFSCSSIFSRFSRAASAPPNP